MAERNGPEHQALREALAKFDDNQSEMARELNAWLAANGRKARVRQSNISWWLHHSYKVPPTMAQGVSAISGVPVERLLPQVFEMSSG